MTSNHEEYSNDITSENLKCSVHLPQPTVLLNYNVIIT